MARLLLVMWVGLSFVALASGYQPAGEPVASPAVEPAAAASRWSGSVELPGNAKLDFSVELTAYAGTITIPMQNVKDMPLQKVSVTPKHMTFSIERAGAVWELDIAEDGQSASGVLKQGMTLKSTLKRLAAGEVATSEVKRPQNPAPPLPYDAAEVTFEHKAAGVTLAGTLTSPPGPGPFPCVVLVSGSGPQDRDETLMGHKPFLVLADHLTRHGIAVLRYDDRGTARSTGDFGAATTDDFALDALAAIEFLKSQPKIDAKRLGIVGHSEGGLIAPMCAAQSKDVAFIVLLAGTGLTGEELLPIQTKLVLRSSGTPEAAAQEQADDTATALAMVREGKPLEEVRAFIREAVLREMERNPASKDLPEAERNTQADQAAAGQAEQLTSPWFRRFLVLDPRENLRKVRCPVLAMNGEKDVQVPAKENLAEIEAALKVAGNADVTTRTLPNLNHLFQNSVTGGPGEYGTIEETFAPAALDVVTSWIRARTGLD